MFGGNVEKKVNEIVNVRPGRVHFTGRMVELPCRILLRTSSGWPLGLLLSPAVMRECGGRGLYSVNSPLPMGTCLRPPFWSKGIGF